MKEILIELRDKLVIKFEVSPYTWWFMCHILKSMQQDCSILKESGLEDLWISKGYEVRNAWTIDSKMPVNFTGAYAKILTKEKIDCLNEIINRL